MLMLCMILSAIAPDPMIQGLNKVLEPQTQRVDTYYTTHILTGATDSN